MYIVHKFIYGKKKSFKKEEIEKNMDVYCLIFLRKASLPLLCPAFPNGLIFAGSQSSNETG